MSHLPRGMPTGLVPYHLAPILALHKTLLISCLSDWLTSLSVPQSLLYLSVPPTPIYSWIRDTLEFHSTLITFFFKNCSDVLPFGVQCSPSFWSFCSSGTWLFGPSHVSSSPPQSSLPCRSGQSHYHITVSPPSHLLFHQTSFHPKDQSIPMAWEYNCTVEIPMHNLPVFNQ